ncbi:crotonase/enoyl-CoA hydratase family protein (plasmid) [Rhodococcus sp. USK10]|uniref:crotonase/enoyl-CoA hydratase family protein n=1 Tax=Rhodococcus sp. USK10 TaxID=2789739 RepID=UPI001C5EECC8|nr:crotonase/enoyl-CoA hydratase family protein [Rhodococcus sp. USK10]QYB00585.1 crotonase/enoyl-CoA hydratase family protein [Rhodococcus sp. USK10]
MKYLCFTVEVDRAVAHIQLSRPEALNTMIPEFWSELPAIIRDLSNDGSIRAAVLSSTGRHFTAGMDLSAFADHNATVADAGRANLARRQRVRAFQDAFTAVEKARMPVLAAIQGGCIGGGVDLVTACDMRYASADAFFVVQETNIGLAADAGVLQRLPKLIPDGIARELVYTGTRMPASRAYEVGLVNQVFADRETMIEEVTAIAREIAQKSPLAVWGSKSALVYARDHSTLDGLDRIADWSAATLADNDITESVAARTEQRQPAYRDLPRIDSPERFARD